MMAMKKLQLYTLLVNTMLSTSKGTSVLSEGDSSDQYFDAVSSHSNGDELKLESTTNLENPNVVPYNQSSNKGTLPTTKDLRQYRNSILKSLQLEYYYEKPSLSVIFDKGIFADFLANLTSQFKVCAKETIPDGDYINEDNTKKYKYLDEWVNDITTNPSKVFYFNFRGDNNKNWNRYFENLPKNAISSRIKLYKKYMEILAESSPFRISYETPLLLSMGKIRDFIANKLSVLGNNEQVQNVITNLDLLFASMNGFCKEISDWKISTERDWKPTSSTPNSHGFLDTNWWTITSSRVYREQEHRFVSREAYSKYEKEANKLAKFEAGLKTAESTIKTIRENFSTNAVRIICDLDKSSDEQDWKVLNEIEDCLELVRSLMVIFSKYIIPGASGILDDSKGDFIMSSIRSFIEDEVVDNCGIRVGGSYNYCDFMDDFILRLFIASIKLDKVAEFTTKLSSSNLTKDINRLISFFKFKTLSD